jgi:alkylation response protein AidB-like acyl-CoA dehydrogenase
MGLRGNASAPMTLDATVPVDHRLGEAGSGFATMMQTVLPWFDLGNASVSVGLSRAAVHAAIAHTSASRLEHLDQSLSALPTIRAQLAKMSIDLAMTSAYLDRTAGRIAEPQDDTVLHVLGVKAAANDAALRITDAAMRVCAARRSPITCSSTGTSGTPAPDTSWPPQRTSSTTSTARPSPTSPCSDTARGVP